MIKKTCVVVPTYWSRKNGEWRDGDDIYDHPTPINEDGTLSRFLESVKILKDLDFFLAIIGISTTDEIELKVNEKIIHIVEKAKLPVDTVVVSGNHITEIKEKLKTHKMDKYLDILQPHGYSNVRNLCLYIPFILDTEVAVFIDDDEVFEDPDFMYKVKEFIGRRFYGNTIDGVAGYYLNEDNEYYDKVDIEPWMTYWNRFGQKREAFDKIIGSEPRLKKTPFAFGGAMVINRNLAKIVPFDPKVTRGEDTDYVINARMFGYNFYLDNKLAIKHLPPKKKHPIWKRFREDIYRFLYNQAKFKTQVAKTNLRIVTPEDFDPYPGEFFKDDLQDKIFKTNIILALNYLSDNKVEDCRQTIKNIYLAKYDAIPKENVFQDYLEFQDLWKKFMERSESLKTEIADVLLKNVVVKTSCDKNTEFDEDKEIINSIDILKHFDRNEVRRFFKMGTKIVLESGDYLFKEGDIDNSIYIVLDGKLVISKNNRNDEETIVGELNIGSSINETSLFFQHPHSVSLKTAEKSVVLQLKRTDLMEIIDENCALSNKLLWLMAKSLSKKLSKTTADYSESEEKSSDVSSRF
jgi:CRP-like cAMP-binding protein